MSHAVDPRKGNHALGFWEVPSDQAPEQLTDANGTLYNREQPVVFVSGTPQMPIADGNDASGPPFYESLTVEQLALNLRLTFTHAGYRYVQAVPNLELAQQIKDPTFAGWSGEDGVAVGTEFDNEDDCDGGTCVQGLIIGPESRRCGIHGFDSLKAPNVAQATTADAEYQVSGGSATRIGNYFYITAAHGLMDAQGNYYEEDFVCGGADGRYASLDEQLSNCRAGWQSFKSMVPWGYVENPNDRNYDWAFLSVFSSAAYFFGYKTYADGIVDAHGDTGYVWGYPFDLPAVAGVRFDDFPALCGQQRGNNPVTGGYKSWGFKHLLDTTNGQSGGAFYVKNGAGTRYAIGISMAEDPAYSIARKFDKSITGMIWFYRFLGAQNLLGILEVIG